MLQRLDGADRFPHDVGHLGGGQILEETQDQDLLLFVRQVAQRRGGWVRVANEGGAVFTAMIPTAAT